MGVHTRVRRGWCDVRELAQSGSRVRVMGEDDMRVNDGNRGSFAGRPSRHLRSVDFLRQDHSDPTGWGWTCFECWRGCRSDVQRIPLVHRVHLSRLLQIGSILGLVEIGSGSCSLTATRCIGVAEVLTSLRDRHPNLTLCFSTANTIDVCQPLDLAYTGPFEVWLVCSVRSQHGAGCPAIVCGGGFETTQHFQDGHDFASDAGARVRVVPPFHEELEAQAWSARKGVVPLARQEARDGHDL